MVVVKRDGEVKQEFSTGDATKDHNAAFAWLLKHQGMSTDWAIRYEGWSIEEVEDWRELPPTPEETGWTAA